MLAKGCRARRSPQEPSHNSRTVGKHRLRAAAARLAAPGFDLCVSVQKRTGTNATTATMHQNFLLAQSKGAPLGNVLPETNGATAMMRRIHSVCVEQSRPCFSCSKPTSWFSWGTTGAGTLLLAGRPQTWPDSGLAPSVVLGVGFWVLPRPAFRGCLGVRAVDGPPMWGFWGFWGFLGPTRTGAADGP